MMISEMMRKSYLRNSLIKSGSGSTDNDPKNITLLGTEYKLVTNSLQSGSGEFECRSNDNNNGDDDLSGKRNEKEEEDRELFIEHFHNLPWFTYRRGMRPLPPTMTHTSDAGWGCMLRSAQMLLAQVLLSHIIANSSVPFKVPISKRIKTLLPLIIPWFSDVPSLQAIYSLHRFTQSGTKNNLLPGQWYGPKSVALVVQELLLAHSDMSDGNNRGAGTSSVDNTSPGSNSIFINGRCLRMLVTGDDCTIYKEESREITANWSNSLFILIPVRLGLTLNQEYCSQIKRLLCLPQTVGIIGGKPRHSLYFVGTVGEKKVLYLDPHSVQTALGTELESNGLILSENELDSCSCKTIKSMSISNLDPSLAFGFYCENEGVFEDLCTELLRIKSLGLDVIHVAEKKPDYDNIHESEDEDDFVLL